MVTDFTALFPRLRPGSFRVTSPQSDIYNCISWAIGDTNNWWWPIDPRVSPRCYWPAGLRRLETLDSIREAFESLGFAVCPNEDVEPGFEKVALFANADEFPLHAARQLPNGKWTSKIGPLEDIEHDLHDLAGGRYGNVTILMKRPITST